MRSNGFIVCTAFLCLVVSSIAVPLRRSALAAPPLNNTNNSTLYECAGIRADRRSCYFSNIYYDISIDTFFVVGVDPGDVDVVAEAVNSSPSYSVGVLREDPPAPQDVVVRRGLNVFWGFNGGVSYSFGHALVHGLYPLYTTLHTLLGGNVPLKFNVMNRSGDTPAVFDHICLASRHRVYDWGKLRQNITAAGKKWIVFEHAMLGDAGLNAFANSLNAADNPPPNLYNNDGWWSFRSWMYRSARLDPTIQPQAQSIALIDKAHSFRGEKDRRRIWNIDDVHTFLKMKHPDTEVTKVNFMKHSWHKQLEILRNTTVFITTEGSASFRYVFLPKGACVIILSHPDNLTEGATPIGAHKPFHEVEKYFPINYIRFIKYRVDFNNKDEYKFWERLQNFLPWDSYDAHIVVKLDRVSPLVSAALNYYSTHHSHGMTGPPHRLAHLRQMLSLLASSWQGRNRPKQAASSLSRSGGWLHRRLAV